MPYGTDVDPSSSWFGIIGRRYNRSFFFSYRELIHVLFLPVENIPPWPKQMVNTEIIWYKILHAHVYHHLFPAIWFSHTWQSLHVSRIAVGKSKVGRFDQYELFYGLTHYRLWTIFRFNTQALSMLLRGFVGRLATILPHQERCVSFLRQKTPIFVVLATLAKAI